MRAIAAMLGLCACTGYSESWDLESPEEASVDWSAQSIPDEVATLPQVEPEPAPVLVREEPPATEGASVQSRPEPTEQERQATCERARDQARADAERDHMHLDAWGYPVDCAFVYWNLLAERYGVYVSHHGCVVYPEEPLVVEYRRCYSQEVDGIVEARHGDDAYEKLWPEAEAICRERQRR